MVLKVGYVLTDERETSGTPRFRFYNPKKYFSKDVYAEIYKPSEKYDVVVFTKRFTNGDIELAKKLDCVKIFDINDNFFELSQYVTKDELNNCIMMASICDAVITPSRYIRDQAQKYNSKSIWIPDFIDDVEETNLVLSWHGLASNVNQLLQHIELFKELNITILAVADWKTNSEKTKEAKQKGKGVIEFIEWSTKNIYNIIQQSDVFISPKLMEEKQWDNGKGFNKALYAIRKGKKVVVINIREHRELYHEFPTLVCLYDDVVGLQQILERKCFKKKNQQTKYSKNISKMWEDVFKSLKVPTISIITAVYNGEKTIKETIESVLNQTFDNFEYIIVDDCSTDDTKNILDKYSCQDPRIKVIYNDVNLKQAKSRNKAIKATTGKYIANIDADDIMVEDRLEVQLKFMKDKKCDISYGGYTAFDITIDKKHAYSSPRLFDEDLFLNTQNLMNNSTIMMKRGIFFDERWDFAEDYSTWLGKYKVGGRLLPLNKNLTFFRLSPTSNSFKEGNINKQIDERDRIIKYWQEYNINKPRISIIMPTYNRLKIISKSIESVLAQSFQEWELIIVNDGGSSLKHIIDSYNDKRIKYFKKENGGLSSALNYGIKQSNTEFISFLDDDDLWTTNHLEIIIKELEKKECHIVYTDCERITSEGEYISAYQNIFNQEYLMFQGNLLTTCSTGFQKTVWERIGGFDETLATHMDWDMWKKAVKLGFNFKRIPIITSYYVVHGKNMLANINSQSNENDKQIVMRR